MEQPTSDEKLNAIIIGGTGATGREIISILQRSNKWGKLFIPVRRQISRFNSISKEESDKIKFIEVGDLDFLSKEKEEILKILGDEFNTTKIHTVFCCLGSRVKYGKLEFYKVDYTYVVNSSTLCEKFNIPHFSLVSTRSADPTSMFYYLEVKGKAEETLKSMFTEKKIETLSIHQPGLIANRDNDCRFGEKIFQYVPFIPKINCIELAGGMIKEAEMIHSDYKNNGYKLHILSNRQIKNLNELNI